MSTQSTSTDINALLDDLDAGIFREKLARALSDAAHGCVAHGKAADVTIKFSLKQIADSSQVDCAHKLDLCGTHRQRQAQRREHHQDPAVCRQRRQAHAVP